MKALKIIALVLVSGLLLAIAGAMAYINYFGPPENTMEWQRLPSRYQQEVERIVPPLPGETYLYYYSLGLWSFEEDGNLITDQRVVSYADEGDGMVMFQSRYEDIRDISVIQGRNILLDTFISVYHDDEDADFNLSFAINGGLDKKAVSYIRQRIAENKASEQNQEEADASDAGGGEDANNHKDNETRSESADASSAPVPSR